MIVTSMSILLTWTPPPENTHNGEIRSYKVHIIDDAGTVIEFNSSSTWLSASSLHPYYDYYCRVSAFTVGYGPFTDALNVTTEEDGWLLHNAGITTTLSNNWAILAVAMIT